MEDRDSRIQKIGLQINSLLKSQAGSKKPDGPPVFKESPRDNLVDQVDPGVKNLADHGNPEPPCSSNQPDNSNG